MLLVIFCVIFVCLVYYYGVKNYNYWKKKGVPYKKPVPYFGTRFDLFFGRITLLQSVCNDYFYNPDARVLGVYSFRKPALIVRDPELIKQVTIKAFENVMDHTPFGPDDPDNPFNKNLFSLRGQKWREMRSTLSPAFTSNKMKMMFDLISECGENMVKHYVRITNDQDGNLIPIEMKDAFTHFTNDVIATSAFGFNVDSFNESHHEFYKNGKIITSFSGRMFLFYMIFPKLTKWIGNALASKTAREYFQNIILNNIKEREEKNITRLDVIHLLMQAKKGVLENDNVELEETGFATVTEDTAGLTGKKQKLNITNDDIVAQALIFFIAGFDTSSTLLTFLSYELAINPDIQKNLQQEIDSTLDEFKGKVTYQSLFKMKYMDMVVSETLRKWPPIPVFDRYCIKNFTLETPEMNINIQEGTTIILPAYGLHHDPKYFSDPEKFIPDRFSDTNKDKIQPYTYIPFGVGPRHCIGSRFALMECKIAVFHMLAKFDFVVIDKTDIPIQIFKDAIRYGAKNGVWLGLKPRK